MKDLILGGLAFGMLCGLLGLVYVAGWWRTDCPRWFLGCTCRDERSNDGRMADDYPRYADGMDSQAAETALLAVPDLQAQAPALPVRSGEGEAGVRTEPPTIAEIELARQRHGFIPELSDLPGPAQVAPSTLRSASHSPRAGELHHSNERTVTRDVWDEWWAGLDGLDRELLACRASREREERLWAELLAETREMCAA